MYIIQQCIDIFFPPTNNEKTIRKWCDVEFSGLYKYQQTSQGISYLSEYHNPPIKAAIQGTKFEQSRLCAKKLALLVREFCHTLDESSLFLPIPLSSKRKRERGFNQVSRVLEYALNDTSHVCLHSEKILTRKRHTKPQTSLERKERLVNMTDAFMVNNARLNTLLKERPVSTVIICDDVITTGTTLQEAYATIKPHLPPQIRLLCVAWAH
jgi:ComF family protein